MQRYAKVCKSMKKYAKVCRNKKKDAKVCKSIQEYDVIFFVYNNMKKTKKCKIMLKYSKVCRKCAKVLKQKLQLYAKVC